MSSRARVTRTHQTWKHPMNLDVLELGPELAEGTIIEVKDIVTKVILGKPYRYNLFEVDGVEYTSLLTHSERA